MDMGGVCRNTGKPCVPPFSCRGLFFLLMECEVCAKLSLDARRPQRRQKESAESWVAALPYQSVEMTIWCGKEGTTRGASADV